MLQNRCDTHVHTLFSRHAYSTVEEDVRAAAEAGLELLGIADHFSSMIATEVHPVNYQHVFNLAGLPRRWHGVSILRGAEMDIVDLEGHLFGHDLVFPTFAEGDVWRSPMTMLERATSRLDYVIASVHSKHFLEGATKAQLTAMYVAALSQPKVLMLGHVGRTGLNVDLHAIVLAAKELGKLLEVNDHSFAYGEPGGERARGIRQRCRDLAELCAEEGVAVAVNSDAHVAPEVGHCERALSLLDEVHFPQELVATTSARTFLAALARAVGPLNDAEIL